MENNMTDEPASDGRRQRSAAPFGPLEVVAAQAEALRALCIRMEALAVAWAQADLDAVATGLRHDLPLHFLDESEDLLGLNQRGGRCVGVNRRAGALCEQSRFAIIIGLADLDRVGPHLDLIFVALVRYAKVLIGDLRRFEPALGERQSDAVRGRIDFEQFVADLDMLSLDDIDV